MENLVAADSNCSYNRRIWLLVVLLVAATVTLSASSRPSFRLNNSAWEATHIVMVKATAEAGVFDVIESWKGDLQPDQRITIPEMRPADDAVPISLYPRDSWGSSVIDTSQIPNQLPGSRLVLFLKKKDAQQLASGTAEQNESSAWQPANPFNDWKTAALWIDGTKLYCFNQFMNPGSGVLVELQDWEAAEVTLKNITEADVKARVDYVVEVQQQLTKAIQIEDVRSRAEALRIYAGSEILLAQRLAFTELGKTGPSALPVLRAMLDDPAFSKLRDQVMHAYVQAGGAALGTEQIARLRSELAFWEATGPSLTQGWWDEDSRNDGPLRVRYSETFEVLRGLKDTAPAQALNTVIELRDFWRSLPQLNDPSGLNRLADECDEVIQRIQPTGVS